jgi:hypothetical protein
MIKNTVLINWTAILLVLKLVQNGDMN